MTTTNTPFNFCTVDFYCTATFNDNELPCQFIARSCNEKHKVCLMRGTNGRCMSYLAKEDATRRLISAVKSNLHDGKGNEDG